MYNHLWQAPQVAVLFRDGQRPLHVPRQTCGRCATVRNPISLVIVHYRGGACRDNPKGESPDWSHRVEAVREQLAAMREDGLEVNMHHTGRETYA